MPQVWLPQDLFISLFVLMMAGPHLSLLDTLEGQGAEEGQTQVPGAQAVQLLAVYIGCFILHRVIHAKMGWAWADVPICTELNKVGL